MACINKRGNTYRIIVSVGRDSAGKQLTKSCTFKPTEKTPKRIEKEVRRYAEEFEKKVLNGEYLDGEQITFDQFIEVWKTEWAEQKLTLRIQEEYADHLRLKASPVIGHMKLAKIKPLHIQSIVTDLQKRGYAPKTIKYTYTAINSVLKYAYRMEVIATNPCDRVELPTMKNVSEMQFFTEDQAQRFLSFLYSGEYTKHYKEHTRTRKATGKTFVVKGYDEIRKIPLQHQVFFTLSIYGGFRRGELIALTWNDIDFRNKTVSINKSVSKTKYKQFEKDPKTAAGNRTIKLPDHCFSLLKKWQIKEKELCMKLGSKWEGYRGKEFDYNNIFISMDSGRRMDVDTPTHVFKDYLLAYNDNCTLEDDKLPLIRLHDLRHTNATLLLGNGADIETVANRLGHEKASVTLDIYGHAIEANDEAAAATLEKLLAVN